MYAYTQGDVNGRFSRQSARLAAFRSHLSNHRRDDFSLLARTPDDSVGNWDDVACCTKLVAGVAGAAPRRLNAT
jgi:hypothetical protein